MKCDFKIEEICDIENGKKWVSPGTLAKLCEVLEIEPYKLFLEVDFEEKSSNKEGVLCGRTTGNIIVEFVGDESIIGTFKNIKITKARNWILNGELVKE